MVVQKDKSCSYSIASIGECMVELQETRTGAIHQSFGGDTLNSAIYMARLGHLLNAQVDYVTAIGCDRFSKEMAAFWEQEGIGSSMTLRQEGEKPGLYFIELDENGERHFSYWRGEAAARKAFEYAGSPEILERLERYDAIYLSGISLAILTPVSRERLITRLTQIAPSGTKICLDYNYRPLLWGTATRAREIYEQVLPCCDLVFAGMDELASIHGLSTVEAGCNYLANLGVRELVIRNGPEPCSVLADGHLVTVAPEGVESVIDTTAAGDSFSGAYLLARIAGCTVEEAAKMAHRMAAYVITHRGAIAPAEHMPDFSNVLKCNRR